MTLPAIPRPTSNRPGPGNHLSCLLILTTASLILTGCGSSPTEPSLDTFWIYQANDEITGVAVDRAREMIYVTSKDANLYALDSSGRVQWYVRERISWAGIPVVAESGVVFAVTYDARLHAITPEGVEAWWSSEDGGFLSLPALAADGSIWIVSQNDNLCRLSSGGTLLSVVDVGMTVTTPISIGPDGSLFVGTNEGVAAFSNSGVQLWEHTQCGEPETALSLVQDGTVLLGTDDWRVYAIAPDGSYSWSVRSDGIVRGTPVVGPDGTIYTTSWDHFLSALSPEGNPIWKHDAGARISVTPVVSSSQHISYHPRGHSVVRLNGNGSVSERVSTDQFLSEGLIQLTSFGIILVSNGENTLMAIETPDVDQANGCWSSLRANPENTGRLDYP